MKTEEVIPGTSKQDSFGLKYLMVRSMFRRPPKQGNCTYTVVSAYLSITTVKRRDIAKQLLGQLWKVTERNNADIIAGDFNTWAYRERGKAQMSSVEEVR